MGGGGRGFMSEFKYTQQIQIVSFQMLVESSGLQLVLCSSLFVFLSVCWELKQPTDPTQCDFPLRRWTSHMQVSCCNIVPHYYAALRNTMPRHIMLQYCSFDVLAVGSILPCWKCHWCLRCSSGLLRPVETPKNISPARLGCLSGQ